MNTSSAKTGGGDAELSKNTKVDLWTTIKQTKVYEKDTINISNYERNATKETEEFSERVDMYLEEIECERDICTNTNRSVQMEKETRKNKLGYEHALESRKLPVFAYNKTTVFAMLAVPAVPCADYFAEQPVFPMVNNSDAYVSEFINTFVNSGNVYRCKQDDSFKRRFLKELSKGNFLYHKWNKTEGTRKLTKKEKYARTRLSKISPVFLIWLREVKGYVGQMHEMAATIGVLGSIGLMAADKYFPAGAMFVFSVGLAIKTWHQKSEEKRISETRSIVSDILESIGSGLTALIRIVEPAVDKFCAFTKALLFATYLAIILGTLALTNYVVRMFLGTLQRYFKADDTDLVWHAHSAAPVAVAAMLCSFVGQSHKQVNVLRSFNYIYLAAKNSVKDVFDFDQYKQFINTVCKYFSQPEPFKLHDWIVKIDAYDSKYNMWIDDPMFDQTLISNELIPQEMREFSSNLDALYKEIRFNATVPAIDKSKVAKMLEWSRTKLRYISKINYKFCRRILPLTLSASGDPGEGKTDAVECLAKALFVMKHGRKMEPSECYPVTDTKYYDGYTDNAWWFHIPEFLGSAFSIENEPIATLYRNIVGTDAIPMNCAALERKDTVSFCSRLVTDTANRKDYTRCGLSDHRALARRVNFPLTVKMKTKFKDSFGSKDFNDAWEFSLTQDCIKNKSIYLKKWHELQPGKVYNFREILDMMGRCYDSLASSPNFSEKAEELAMSFIGHGTSPISKDKQNADVKKCLKLGRSALKKVQETQAQKEEYDYELISFPFVSTDDSSSESSASLGIDESKFEKHGMDSIELEFPESSSSESSDVTKQLKKEFSRKRLMSFSSSEESSSEEELIGLQEIDASKNSNDSGSESEFSLSRTSFIYDAEKLARERLSSSDSFSLGIESITFSVKVDIFDHGIKLSTTHKELDWTVLIMAYGKKQKPNYKLGTIPLDSKVIALEHDGEWYIYKGSKLTRNYNKLAPLLYLFFHEAKFRSASVAIAGSKTSCEDPCTVGGYYISDDEKEYYEYVPGVLAIKDHGMTADQKKEARKRAGYVAKCDDPCSLPVIANNAIVSANVDDIVKSRPVLHPGVVNGSLEYPIILLQGPPTIFSRISTSCSTAFKSTLTWGMNAVLNGEQWKLYAILGTIVTVLLGSTAVIIAAIAGVFGEDKKKLAEDMPDILETQKGSTYWYDPYVQKGTKRPTSKKKTVSPDQVRGTIKGFRAHGKPEQDALTIGNNIRLVKFETVNTVVKTWMFMLNSTVGVTVGHAVKADVNFVKIYNSDDEVAPRVVGTQDFKYIRPNEKVDMCVFYFKSPITGIKDVTKRVVSSISPLSAYCRLTTVVNGKRKGVVLSKPGKASITDGFTMVENDGDEMSVAPFYFVHDSTAAPGDCGLPYLTLENGCYKIAGIHFAGSYTFSGFVHLTQEKLQEWLHLADRSSFPFTAHCAPAVLDSMVPEFRERSGILNMGKLTTKPSFSPKSRVKPSPLYQVPKGKSFPEDDMRPATLIGPTSAKTFKFDRKGELIAHDMAHEMINSNILNDFAPSEIFNDLPDPDSASLEDLLFGTESISSLSDKTSVGPMYKRGFHPSKFIPKTKKELFCTEDRFISPQLRKDFELRIKEAETGAVHLPVVERSLKEEVRSVEEKGIYRSTSGKDHLFCAYRDVKDKQTFIQEQEDLGRHVFLDIEPREFYPTDPIDILECKSILWPIIDALHHDYLNTMSVVGINPISADWRVLMMQVVRPKHKPIFFDIKSCDKTVIEAFWKTIFIYFQSIYNFKPGSPKWFRLRAACYKLLHFIYFAENFVYVIDGSNPSGQWLTCLLNGMWILFILKSTFKILARQLKLEYKFSEMAILKVFGDDLILSVHEEIGVWYNRHTIAQLAKQMYNVVFTALDKTTVYDTLDSQPLFDSWKDLEFLQRTFKLCGHFVYAPLRIGSIWRSLKWSSTNFRVVDAVEHYEQIMPEAMLEFALHGKEVFLEAEQILRPRFIAIGGTWKNAWRYDKVLQTLHFRLCGGCDKHSHGWK